MSVIVAVLASGTSIGQCVSEACLRATEWHKDFTAIHLEKRGFAAAVAAKEFIESQGGTIAFINERILLGWIPPMTGPMLGGRSGVRQVYTRPVNVESFRLDRGVFAERQAQILLSFFNEIASGRFAAQVEQALQRPAPPLVNDVKGGVFEPAASSGKESTAVWIRNRGGMTPAQHGDPPFENEAMTGRVHVNIFEIESDGSAVAEGSSDSDEFTWTVPHQNSITSQALAGLAFWSNQAQLHSRSVSFLVSVWEPYNGVCRQGYEAIRHHSNDDFRWVNEVMRKFDSLYGGRPGGYGATSPLDFHKVMDQVEAFNNDQKNFTYPASDWAFTVFVAYNPPPAAPETFTGDVLFAYVRDYGGPWVQMLYNMGGYGTDRFNEVMTHETGHVFWACDEYFLAGYGGCDTCLSCRSYGPRAAATNRNCANPAVSCSFNQDCQMRNNAAILCADTPIQIGW